MKPTEVSAFLERTFQTPGHPPVFLWGPPGVGKSSVVAQVSSKLTMHLLDIRAALLDPIDLRGLIMPYKGKAVWWPPVFLPPSDSKECWVFFLDELNLAPLTVQHACYQLILDKKVGEYTCPEHSTMLAAGNRTEDRAGTRDLPAPLMNRFCHIQFLPDTNDFCNWAVDNGVSAEVIAFLRLNSDLLFKFDPVVDKGAFASPRSIVFADRIWRAHRDTSYTWEAIEGTVGREWASKFSAYLKIYTELPSVEDILAGKSATVPARSDLRYAVAALLGTRTDPKNIEHVLRYADRLPVEHAAFLVQLILRKAGMLEVLGKSAAWKAWIVKHKEILR